MTATFTISSMSKQSKFLSIQSFSPKNLHFSAAFSEAMGFEIAILTPSTFTSILRVRNSFPVLKLKLKLMLIL